MTEIARPRAGNYAIAVMLVTIATVLHALVVRFGGQNMPFLLYYPLLAGVAWCTSLLFGTVSTGQRATDLDAVPDRSGCVCGAAVRPHRAARHVRADRSARVHARRDAAPRGVRTMSRIDATRPHAGGSNACCTLCRTA
jgi:hypothetical protein